MKSAYGRQTPAPDYELTYVEPGSPMGELQSSVAGVRFPPDLAV